MRVRVAASSGVARLQSNDKLTNKSFPRLLAGPVSCLAPFRFRPVRPRSHHPLFLLLPLSSLLTAAIPLPSCLVPRQVSLRIRGNLEIR